MLFLSSRLNLLSRELGLRCNAREPHLESSLHAVSIGCAQTVFGSHDQMGLDETKKPRITQKTASAEKAVRLSCIPIWSGIAKWVGLALAERCNFRAGL
jgi:hypothetical protein